MTSPQADTKMKQEKLKFLPFSSMIDSTFWYSLSRLKLEHLRLDDAPLPIYATFHAELNSALPALASLNYETFQQLQQQHLPSDIQQRPQNSTEHLLHGHLKLFNALPEFNGSDKRQLIADAGQTIWESIIDEGKQSEVDADLELHLSRFLMVAFADLKRYSYHYWCAFPALNFPTSCFEILESSGGETLRDHFTSDQVASLLQQYGQLPSTDKLFFAVIVTTTLEGDQKTEKVKVEGYKSFWSSAINSLNGDNSKVYFTFLDPSSNALYAGWPARNYLAYLYVRLAQLQSKPNPNTANIVKSLFTPHLHLLSLRFPPHTISQLSDRQANQLFSAVIDSFYQNSALHAVVLGANSEEPLALPEQVPPTVGWERNSQTKGNQLVPRFVDCSRQLDPKVLSNDAVHLNLELMKWRIVPELNLQAISSARCLLLGAGTLGCNVARALLAWGVSEITFVDSGTVSHSNPVRQSLYTFEDCLSERKTGVRASKAFAAAAALRLIHPGVIAEAHQLAIPMPGHAVSPLEVVTVRASVKQLQELIQTHDVIFLLMDSRESRWLPTVMAAAAQKLVINVALGFDTFLVQRHGVRLRKKDSSSSGNAPHIEEVYSQLKASKLGDEETLEESTADGKMSSGSLLFGHQLGCYFCNDIFAPGNSSTDRTLDQQCTVTRPGASMIAAGYAVELMASLLQHPAKALAPAIISSSPSSSGQDSASHSAASAESVLGVVPHQIRGFLSRFEQLTPSYGAFEHCIACSFAVLEKLCPSGRSDEDFLALLLEIFREPTILESMTGLQKYHLLDEADISSLDSDDGASE